MKKIHLLLFFISAALFQLQAGEYWFSEKFPAKLINSQGVSIDTAEALKGKKVAIYFSAHWCGPCRNFTPKLVKLYNETAKAANIEIVFISSDRSAEKMAEYMKSESMPWLAVPFDSEKRSLLKQEYQNRFIPRLLVLDENGKIISVNATGEVFNMGAAAVEKWIGKSSLQPTDNTRNTAKPAAAKVPASGTGLLEIDPANWLKGPADNWHIRLDKAFSAARKQKKKIFILTTGSDWCGWCKKLYDEVLSSEHFQEFAAKNFILVYLDNPKFKKQPEAQQLYNEIITQGLKIRMGAPAAYILNRDGSVQAHINGYSPLDKYMERLNTALKSPGDTKVPPRWVKSSPLVLKNRLIKLKKQKNKNAKTAQRQTEKIKNKLQFQVVSWGYEKNNADTPFSAEEQLKIPLEKSVYFKVKYQVPPEQQMRMWLNAQTSYVSSFAHIGKGTGEFTAVLRARKPARENKLQIKISLTLPESKSTLAAELPCNIIWGDIE